MTTGLLILAHTATTELIASIALAAATIGSGALAGAILLRRRNRHARAYIAALERLNDVALRIASSPGDVKPLLDRLASAARELLDLSMSCIALLEDDGKTLRQIHCAGVQHPHADFATGEINADPDGPLFGWSAAKRCLESGKGIFAANVRRESGDFDPAMIRKYSLSSVIVLPLISSDRHVGLMMLADARPRHRFSDAQRRLAELLAAHAAITVANARLYHQMDEAIRSHRRAQAQRDMLYNVNTAMQRVDSLEEAFSRITQLAPTALEVEACVICLLEDPLAPPMLGGLTFIRDSMRISAVTALPYPFPLKAGQVEHSPLFEKLIRTGRAIRIEDADTHPWLRERGLDSTSGVGSVLCMPLWFKGGGPIGALLLIRRGKGRFSDDTVRFAEMFSSRAAIAIENVRLREQAHRDAQTKATLLQELNHRVKNNLAGLIGLLSMGTPPMSSEAQHWLDRVIERISALAKAHELFSSGRDVRLSQMIDTTLHSISAIKPDAVRVDVDLGNSDPVLPAAYTVPCALVVYELAYNAIVHGVGEAGRLCVRVRQPQPETVEIEIADEPTPAPAAIIAADLESGSPAPVTAWSARDGSSRNRASAGFHRSHGIGLTLVRGLVSRELRGMFDIRSSSAGGTIACVSFSVHPATISLANPGLLVDGSPDKSNS